MSNKGRVSREVDFPAFVDGWRTDVPLSDMPKGSAAVLNNFFPEATKTRARRGFAPWATGVGTGNVNSILAYNGSTPKLFGASGANIYDITVTGAAGAAVQTGKTSDRWHYTNFTNPAGKWVIAVNGLDTPINYNGSTWNSATAMTGTGLTVSNLFRVTSYRSRLWFLEKGTTRLWYLATDAVGGTLTSLEVGSVMKKGGSLIAIGTWSVPTQSGLDQSLVLMSDQGELIVYTGSDPSSATTWAMKGTFELGRPLGDKPLTQVGGDLAVTTQEGIVPVSQAITLDRSALQNVTITKKIQPTWADAVSVAGSATVGWELANFSQRRMAVVNIPFSGAVEQYVMNTTTGAWCRFTGMQAYTWAVWNDGLYFGSANGTVYKAETGSLDDTKPIDCLAVGAYTRFGSGFSQKQIKLLSMTVNLGPNTQAWCGVSVDYVTKQPTAVFASSLMTAARWGIPRWGQAVWPGERTVRKVTNANGIGYAFAPTLRVLIAGDNSSTSAGDLVGGSIAYEMGAPV